MKHWRFLIFILMTVMIGNSSVRAMGRKPEAVPAKKQTRPMPVPKTIMTLLDCYRNALARSEEVALRREDIAQARADWFQASSEVIGDGDFYITEFRQQEGGSDSGSSVGSTLSAEDRRERTFSFSQPLFQGFKSWGALGGAGSLTKQRKKEYQRAKELLFLDVMTAFYTLLQQRRDVKTIEGIHQLFEDRVKELGEREQIGRSRRSELVTARAKMKILEAQLAQARGALGIAQSLMEYYTGLPADRTVFKETPLPENLLMPHRDAEVLDRRSDVEASKHAVKTARQAIIVAQSDLWPTITVDANHYEKRDGFQSGIDWDVLVKFNMPLYRGGATVSQIKKSWSQWKKAKYRYSLSKRQAELEIKRTYQNWISAIEEDKAFRDAVKAAQLSYNLQRDEYGKNLVNNLDVLTALEELFSTSREANRAYYQMRQYYWQYQTAIGRCCYGTLSENAGGAKAS